LTSFLSTFVNRVDRKGRVSVPAQFRAALAGESFQGIIAYPSMANSAAIDAFGRSVLEELNRKQFERKLADGNFESALLGGDSVVDTIMALAHELPFDGEGRIVLPSALAEPAGITERATFVGRGSRFQIWAPDAWERHQKGAVEALRERLARNGSGGGAR
jgi:MraZ protein